MVDINALPGLPNMWHYNWSCRNFSGSAVYAFGKKFIMAQTHEDVRAQIIFFKGNIYT